MNDHLYRITVVFRKDWRLQDEDKRVLYDSLTKTAIRKMKKRSPETFARLKKMVEEVDDENL